MGFGEVVCKDIDFTQALLVLIHKELVCIGMCLCMSTESAERLEKDWNANFNRIIEMYKAEGEKDGEQV